MAAMSVSARLSLRDRAAAIEAGRMSSSAAPSSTAGALAGKLGASRTPRSLSGAGARSYAAPAVDSAAAGDGSELAAAKSEITRLKVRILTHH